ncbi:hypothetical protein BKA70DRAFT_1437564 [Coprinopsis sp. MPI-PUGE-AT-0042]|nr:hypothetical protein BKA70DRAFT_1437564 [Coprinopsis sp. MPI-PUGE-AT-0042]
MSSAFSIKYRRTLGGPPTEEVAFELMDTSSGLQRRVDWKPTSGFGEFIYQTDATPSSASTSTSAQGGSEAASASTEQDHPPQPSNA